MTLKSIICSQVVSDLWRHFPRVFCFRGEMHIQLLQMNATSPLYHLSILDSHSGRAFFSSALSRVWEVCCCKAMSDVASPCAFVRGQAASDFHYF